MTKVLLFVLLLFPGVCFSQSPYQTHCAACHGADRLGGMGPALLPENLSRLKKAEAARMRQAGGSVELDSSPGAGTRVHLRFAQARPAAHGVCQPQPEAREPVA